MAQEAVERMKSSHPTYMQMIKAAITYLNEKNGSSRQKITKYLMVTYMVSPELQRVSYYVKKTLKKAVDDGEVIQTSGTGANGRFKMANKGEEAKASVMKKSKGVAMNRRPKKTVTTAGKVIKKKIVKRRASIVSGSITAITPSRKRKPAAIKAPPSAAAHRLNATYNLTYSSSSSSSSSSSADSLFSDIPLAGKPADTIIGKPVAVIKASTVAQNENKMETTKEKMKKTTTKTTLTGKTKATTKPAETGERVSEAKKSSKVQKPTKSRGSQKSPKKLPKGKKTSPKTHKSPKGQKKVTAKKNNAA